MLKSSSNSAKGTYPRFSREELVGQLRQGVASLRAELPVKRAVLFGSWAAGRATAFSDIDALVVYEETPREGAYAVVRRDIPIRGLEPHIYTEEEAEVVRKTLDRMTQSGVLLLPA